MEEESRINHDRGRYQGDFLNGFKEGKGIAKCSDGSEYEGEWIRRFRDECREVVKRIFVIID